MWVTRQEKANNTRYKMEILGHPTFLWIFRINEENQTASTSNISIYGRNLFVISTGSWTHPWNFKNISVISASNRECLSSFCGKKKGLGRIDLWLNDSKEYRSSKMLNEVPTMTCINWWTIELSSRLPWRTQLLWPHFFLFFSFSWNILSHGKFHCSLELVIFPIMEVDIPSIHHFACETISQ